MSCFCPSWTCPKSALCAVERNPHRRADLLTEGREGGGVRRVGRLAKGGWAERAGEAKSADCRGQVCGLLIIGETRPAVVQANSRRNAVLGRPSEASRIPGNLASASIAVYVERAPRGRGHRIRQKSFSWDPVFTVVDVVLYETCIEIEREEEAGEKRGREGKEDIISTERRMDGRPTINYIDE